jgi:hypothetical protein
MDLRKDNFEVFEGKTPQTIRHFSSEDVPVSLGWGIVKGFGLVDWP